MGLVLVMDGGELTGAGERVMSMSSSLGLSLPWICLAMLDLELSLDLGCQYFHFLTCAL